MSNEIEHHIRWNEDLRAYEILRWTGCIKFEQASVIKRFTKKEFNKLIELLCLTT